MLLVGCSDKKSESNSEVKNETQVLKVAFNQSEKHPQYKALAEFGKKLEEQTKGTYKLEILPNVLLGDQRATVELTQNGVIQMAVVGNPVVENFNKDFAVIGLPYFSYTNHLMVPDLIIINEKIYSEMSDENKKIFENLVKEMIGENQTFTDMYHVDMKDLR